MPEGISVSEIAGRLGGEVEGDGDVLITGLSALREAGPGDLSFVVSAKFAADAAATQATAVLVSPEWDKPCSAIMIRVKNPDEAFTSITPAFAPPPVERKPGIHPSAVLAPDVECGPDVHIGPHCVVDSGARIGARSVLMAGCYVGQGVELGEEVMLYPHVSVREYSRIGNRVLIHDGTVVGSDGFGYVVDDQGVRTKVPQVGIVEIGNDVEIGANVTIDRARFGKTRIGNGVKIDNLVQIAHNVVLGDHAVVVAQVGISGSTEVGPHAILAGQAGIAGHLKIGAGAVVLAQSGVWKDVESKTQVFGYPALPQRQAMSLQRAYMKLPRLQQKIAALEQRLKEIEDTHGA